jgi:hypothetical protein
MKIPNALAIVTLGIAAANTPAALSGQHARHTIGQEVMLSSCVEAGQKPDTFVLTHTADVPVHPATAGRVVYWLDSVKSLREQVGHQVRVKGTITEVKQSEMEVKLGEDGKGGWTVEIEGPGREVRTTPNKAGVDTTNRQSEEDDIKTTLVKLKVNEVVMAAEKCET